jgi:hypothetical protein
MEASIRTGMRTCLGDNPPSPNAKLLGWAVIAEWETPQGGKLLSRMSSDDVSPWGFRGYLHEALHGDWAAGTEGWDGREK